MTSTDGNTRRSARGVRRVGFLGAGYIAEWHAKALASVPGTELVAVCDRIEARAAALARQFRVPASYASLEAMLDGAKPDAVHVLLPPDLHHDATRTLLSRGVDVLLEKPMCVTSAECDDLAAYASTQGRSLGVAHNFLFAEPWERLRADVRAGLLGTIDHVDVTWHKELPQAIHGPFDIWMLRAPRNILLEIGSHSVACVLDLLGEPDVVAVEAGNPVTLPTGQPFFRRWRAGLTVGRTAVELRFSFVPGFAEHAVHVRGSLGSATVDFHRHTYVLRRPEPVGDDFERWAGARAEAAALRRDARRTLQRYVLSKLHLHGRGSPYGAGISGALEAFHGAAGRPLDSRISASTGAMVIQSCERVAAAARLPERPGQAPAVVPASTAAVTGPVAVPRALVLGATGFIGRELVRQLVSAGTPARLLVRSPSKLPADLRSPLVEAIRGDVESPEDLATAMRGIDVVYHLSRASVKTWPDYQRLEVEATGRIAEAAMAAAVKRFVYTGTIDSYYAGAGAGTITEHTPLDPRITRRNLYARAKAESERRLVRMHRESGLPLVILRPGIVIGRGGSPFHWGVGMWWSGSVCQIWGDGDNKLPLVLVEDVARAVRAAGEAPGVVGESFNLVGDPVLSANEYLDELDRAAGIRLRREPTPVVRFWAADMIKWVVKVAVRHPDRRMPSYRDWESRTQRAAFDCSKAKERLGWRPVADRRELVRLGIEVPVAEFTG